MIKHEVKFTWAEVIAILKKKALEELESIPPASFASSFSRTGNAAYPDIVINLVRK